MNRLLLLFVFVSISLAQIIGGGGGKVSPGGTHKWVGTGGAAGGGCALASHTQAWATDPEGSTWVDDLGTATWDNVNENVDFSGAGTVYYYNTSLDCDSGYAKVHYENANSAYYGGILFRYDTATDLGYVVRYNGESVWKWRYCTDASCNDIGTTTESSGSGEIWFGIHWAGTGDNTVVKLWIDTSSDLGSDPSTWGTPDHTFTDDPGVNARDDGRYVGLYEGGDVTTFDDFYAETDSD